MIAPPIEQPVFTGDCSMVSSYGWDTRVAYAICMAESQGNTNAVGDDYPIAGLHAPSCGLFQIRTLAGRPSCEELKNPAINLEWAYQISGGGTNWTLWSVYTSGAYLRYL